MTKEMIGKVLEIFIPCENELIDKINSKNIGFKILVNDEIVEIIEEQNEKNARILKEDLVKVVVQKINAKKFISLEVYEREEDE